MNLGTAVVLLIVIAVAALAARSVFKKKGGCDCGCNSEPGSAACSGCDGCNTKVYGINTGPGIDQPTQCPHCK